MQQSWRQFVLRLPVALAVAIVVAVSVGLSLFALFATTAVFGHESDSSAFVFELAIATAIPIFVATPVSWIIVKLLHETDAAWRAAQHLAWKDDLTGLLNRRRFIELAGREMDLAQRSKLPIAAAVLDIDRFKHVNDQFGHAVGDAVLRAVAQAIHGALRSTDLLGRWGGEEFALVLPQTTRSEALEVMERLTASLRALRIDTGSGAVLVCTASIGVASRERDGERLEDLIGRADAAMYGAKSAGRNRVQLAPVATARAAPAAPAAPAGSAGSA
jgi:diguanylate cyclase (GGDEF)-like protein